MGVLLIAARKLPQELMNYPEFEAFVDICGVILPKRKIECARSISDV